MPTLVLDPAPFDFQALLERRRATGADTHDEIWEGVLHMAPAPLTRHADVQAQLLAVLLLPARAVGLRTIGDFNLGERNDFRVPDGGLLLPGPNALYMDTAALVFEVLSPNDETPQKLPFYAEHGVSEVLIVDPEARTVEWLGLRDGSYEPIARSGVIDFSVDELVAQIDWPAA